MFFAIISKLYDPSAITEPKESKGICYSRWFFKKDWTLNIKQVTGSSTHKTDTPSSKIIDGTMNRPFHSASYDPNPYILVELNEPKVIKNIFVMTRIAKLSHFKNVFVEVGMTQTSLIHFDAFISSTDAPLVTLIEFNGRPIKAKFIKISKKQNEINLVFDEIAILGE